ncbi:hypothetical protein HY745_11740 [Candidatus Desantisbacteria bacterium]|nr:hypothetical protein [Candidatus Desantisbacteria bacterium]
MDKIKEELNKILSRGRELEHAFRIQYMVNARLAQKELLNTLKKSIRTMEKIKKD